MVEFDPGVKVEISLGSEAETTSRGVEAEISVLCL
jgi:hypothetical protein